MPKIFGIEISNCVNCFYKREYQEMGATWNVCERYNDLAEATKAYKNSQNCQYKLTHQQVKEIIQKQIPKKVKIEKYAPTRCNCGFEFSVHYGDGYYSIPFELKTPYCRNCGQALDWSDEK